jgi:hypothetical protein
MFISHKALGLVAFSIGLANTVPAVLVQKIKHYRVWRNCLVCSCNSRRKWKVSLTVSCLYSRKTFFHDHGFCISSSYQLHCSSEQAMTYEPHIQWLYLIEWLVGRQLSDGCVVGLCNVYERESKGQEVGHDLFWSWLVLRLLALL